MTEDATPQPPVFVRGNDHLDRLLSDPQVAADVTDANAAAEEMDRIYAMNLAMIRKAARKQWTAEAAVRRVNDPYPLPVTWTAADPSLTERWHKLETLAGSGAGWPPPAANRYLGDWSGGTRPNLGSNVA